MTDRERLVDINNLKKYPEFYAFKKELEDFCDKMNSISDVDITQNRRVSLESELFGRRYAVEKVSELLYSMGLLDRVYEFKDKTHE